MTAGYAGATLGVALLLSSVSPTIADPVGFRNPIEAPPSPSSSSSVATCANALAFAQVADDYTTSVIIRGGGYERDPLTKPFVHSLGESLAASAVVNVVARLVTRRRPQVLCAAAIGELPFVGNNVRAIARHHGE